VRRNGGRWWKRHELERVYYALAAEAEVVFDCCLPIEG
jgi:hypothetical protein